MEGSYVFCLCLWKDGWTVVCLGHASGGGDMSISSNIPA